MLYVTTRDQKDAYTAPRTWKNDFAPDNGLFIPFKFPIFSDKDIIALKDQTFGQIAAKIINLFFSSSISEWEFDLCIGKSPAKIELTNYKIVHAQLWHNPNKTFSYYVENIFERICKTQTDKEHPTEWIQIVSRIAFLFALYGELCRSDFYRETNSMDIAIEGESFYWPIAVCYAKKMGLPFGKMLIGCSENNGAWNFIRRGTINLSGANQSIKEFERLIYDTLGNEKASHFAKHLDNGLTYALSEEDHSKLTCDMYASTVSNARIKSIVANVFQTNSYTPDIHTALAYGCLQDYRASVGESNPVLLISENAL